MSSAQTFEVIPLGVGNFFSTFRFCTSLLIRAGERTILVDCPDPFFRMAHFASEKSGVHIHASNIDDIVLTHLHGDHCNGLEAFGFYRRYVCDRDVTPRIHTSPEAANGLWSKLAAAMGSSYAPELNMNDTSELSDYYEMHTYKRGSKFEVAGVQFESRSTIHTVPTFGFRASFNGRVLGYSCDTSFDPKMIEFLEPANLIFHECDRGIHTSIDELEKLPAKIQKKMHLVHLNDQFEGSKLIRNAEEGRIYKV